LGQNNGPLRRIRAHDVKLHAFLT